MVQSPELPLTSRVALVSHPIISSLSFPVCTMGVVVVSTLQGWYEVQQESSDQVLGDNAREAERRGQKYRDRKERAASVLGSKIGQGQGWESQPPCAAIMETSRNPLGVQWIGLSVRSLPGAWVQSLLGELRSQKSRAMAK